MNRDSWALFGGQGSQYFRMGEALWRTDGVFRATLEEADALLARVAGLHLIDCLYAPARQVHEPFTDLRYTHPATLAVQIAAYRALAARGFAPSAFAGYSLGELAAAVAADALTFAAALTLANAQAELLARRAVPGAMLAVLHDLSTWHDQPEWFSGVELAARNHARHFVVAGEARAIAEVAARLRARAITVGELPVREAFHTSRLDGPAAELRRLEAALCWQPPRIPVFSTSTQAWLQLPPPGYTVQVVRQPIRWDLTAERLHATDLGAVIDFTPGGALANFLRHGAPKPQFRVSSWLTPFGHEDRAWASLLPAPAPA